MKQSKMTLIALVIILIGLALCTIHIVYADNQNSKEASSNDLGFMQQSFDTKQVEHTSKTKLTSYDKSGQQSDATGNLSDLSGNLTTNNSTGSNSLGNYSEIVGGSETKIPKGLGKKHSYTSWQSVNSSNKDAFKLVKKTGLHFDNEGFAKIRGRYVVICTKVFGDVGDYVDFYKENGTVIPCIIGDIKNSSNKWGTSNGKDVLDFFVDRATWYPVDEGGNQQLDSVSFKIQEDDLEEICDYFEKLTEYFDNIQNNNSKVTSIENIIKKLNTIGNALETGNKQLTLVVMIVLCFIFYFAFKFVFPIYVIALAMFTIYNVKLSSKIYTTSLLRKVIEDNISAIEQMYRDKALAQLNQEKRELEESYKETKNELENELSDTKNKLESILMSAKERFTYDDDKLRENQNNLLIVNKNKKSELERLKLQEKQKYDSLLKELEVTKQQFDQAADNLKNKYINFDKVGDSYVMDKDFLLDIDAVTKKPKFFEFNFGSNLFIYSDITDVINFIKLFVVQVRARLKPSCINMTIFDDKFMGRDYLCFKETEDDKYDNIMRLLINKEELKNYVGELSELSITRTTNIKREFNNIIEYNNFMLSQNSLPESYTFFFVQDIVLNTLLETTFRQILLNGSDLGIYPFVFLSMENFSQGGNDAKELIKYFDNIYTFDQDATHQYEGSNTILKRKAKDFVLERILGEES